MEPKVGDRVSLDAKKVGQARRSGVVRSVIKGLSGVRYQIRWDDETESMIFPGAGILQVEAGAGGAKRAAAPKKAARRAAAPKKAAKGAAAGSKMATKAAAKVTAKAKDRVKAVKSKGTQRARTKAKSKPTKAARKSTRRR